jgi:hypothetical protein
MMSVDLTLFYLFYTRGLAIVVLLVMVSQPYGFPLCFSKSVWQFDHAIEFSFKWVKVMLSYKEGEGCLILGVGAV